MAKQEWKNIKKLGLGIVAFEGTEHLASIITEIKDYLDYVVIGLQKVSYHGDPIAQTDLNECIRLYEEDKLVDKILDVQLDSGKEPRVQEADKRNLLMADCEAAGCSHVIIIDSDEFYTKGSFFKALQEIDENDYEQTYCQYINYYTLKSFLVYPFAQGMYVPFVVKSKYRVSYDSSDFNMPSDPTRRYLVPHKVEKVYENGKAVERKIYDFKYHIFPWNVVKMHHLSWCRADIRKKLNMWSSKRCFKNYNDLIDKAVDICQHYDDNTTEDQKVSLLFNTPNHEVIVRPMAKQYIHPAFDYKTRLRPAKDKKKMLVLNMSSTNSSCNLFNELDKASRETWAKGCFDGTYDNIDYYTVIDAKESKFDPENHIIYVKTDYTKDNTIQLLQRYLEACRMFKNLEKYNYILRTNTSTWCNLDVLDAFLSYETDDSLIYGFGLEAAFWSVFRPYVSGAAIIMAPRNVEILQRLVDATPAKQLEVANDDVTISALFRLRAEQLKFKDSESMFVGLNGSYLSNLAEETSYTDIDWSRPFYQVKTMIDTNWSAHDLRLSNDIEKMHKLDEAWRKDRPDDLTQLVENLRNNINKTIRVNKYLKKEWLSGNLSDKDKMSVRFNEMPNNSETKSLLYDLSKKGGYVSD